MALLTITASDLLREPMIPAPQSSDPEGLEILIPMGGVDISTGDMARVPVTFEPHLPPGHFDLLMSIDQQTKKGLAIQPEVINPGHHQEVELLVCNGEGRNTFSPQVIH